MGVRFLVLFSLLTFSAQAGTQIKTRLQVKRVDTKVIIIQTDKKLECELDRKILDQKLEDQLVHHSGIKKFIQVQLPPKGLQNCKDL